MLARVFLFLCLNALTARAVSIVNYNATVNDRFASGYPSTPVANGSVSFVGAGLDWSGVGWDSALPSRSVAMISDQHFVFANHYQPGSTIQFLSPILGTVVSYTVQSVTRLNSPVNGQPSDFSVGRLTTALNPAHGIATYPVLDLPSLNDYLGLQVMIYGHGGIAGTNSPRIGLNEIEDFFHYDEDGNILDNTFFVGYDFDSGSTGQAQFEGGDSGSPTFAYLHGQLALVGTHSATGTVSGQPWSFDNFIPVYLDQMSTLGVDFTTVPEPARAMLLLAGLSAIGLRRKKSGA
jgi:hypothetical protein